MKNTHLFFFALLFLSGCFSQAPKDTTPSTEMVGMPCHQMGGQWMGDCERDENGKIIPPQDEKVPMMKDGGEKFSDDSEGLSEAKPTELVRLSDGDTFELKAEMVQQEVGNRTIKRFAYNRQIPGPILQVEKGATITLILRNALDIPTTLHSHGIRLDDDFDGVPFEMGGLQDPILPGENFAYTITFPDAGAYWYHPHIREDYTQELGLYGNFSVTEQDYWNPADREEFLVLDDFSEDDPFYQDMTNKTLMGRFGNILLINNKTDYEFHAKTGERLRFFVTNTANTRTFDITVINPNIQCVTTPCGNVPLRIVGGDIGRVEKEFMAENFIIAPAERIIFETVFSNSGKYQIQHRGKTIGNIVVEEGETTEASLALRKNTLDYFSIRDNFQEFLKKPIDKNLRLTIGMKGQEEMRMGMKHEGGMGNMMNEMMGDKHEEGEKIEWEDTMPGMNAMSNDVMMEWIIMDETNLENPKKNMDMSESWKFQKGSMVKVKIFNDPESIHPMQHPIHFHGQRFVVLTRDEIPNENLQWKDTTLVQNGETIEILVEMSNPGKWMTHCHIAEHMHAGMMFNFEVLE